MGSLIQFITEQLSDSLPGAPSQLKMAPKPVNDGTHRKITAPDDAHRSSVLILLSPNTDNAWELTLTLRSSDIDHGGQISFPGGRAEQGENARQTALRETQEEIGINPADITIIGQLSTLYVSHSHNNVIPIIGFIDHVPEFSVNPAEVEEVFTINLDDLLQKGNINIEHWELHNDTYRVPYWNVHRVPLWGATAMILSELLELYRAFLEQKKK